MDANIIYDFNLFGDFDHDCQYIMIANTIQIILGNWLLTWKGIFWTVTKKISKKCNSPEICNSPGTINIFGTISCFLHYFPALLTIVTVFVVFCSIFICFKLFFGNKNGFL